MNPRPRPDRVMPRRLQALVADLSSAASGDVKALHRTRVASRRVREALPIVGLGLALGSLKKARRKTRALTRALGSVRELDVALDVLAHRPTDTDTRRMALERVRAQIIQERHVRHVEMQRQLHLIKPNKLVRKLSVAADEGIVPADRRQTLGSRLQSRAGTLQAALEQTGPLYLADRLHAARIAIKKLRYTLEIAGDYRAGATAQAVKSLRDMQETLGRLHDIEVVNLHIHRAQARVGTSDPALAAEVSALVREGEQECRALHARFLADRPRLMALAEQARLLGARLLAADRRAPAATTSALPPLEPRDTHAER